MSDEEDKDLPSAADCQKRVEQFVEITNTDEALAQFYLQDREWNLESSIQAYFAENVTDNEGEGRSVAEEAGPKAPKRAKHTDGGGKDQERSADKSTEEAVVDHFTFVTWNLAGLDDKNLGERTDHAVKLLLERNVDVIFL